MLAVVVIDKARILSKAAALSAQIIELEKTSGWKVRVITSYGRPSDDDLRAALRQTLPPQGKVCYGCCVQSQACCPTLGLAGFVAYAPSFGLGDLRPHVSKLGNLLSITSVATSFGALVQSLSLMQWWLIVFSPLWLSLFGSFGLGPIINRTEDKLPVLQSSAVFALFAASPYLLAAIRAPPLDTGGS
jgi:hypothetical protein